MGIFDRNRELPWAIVLIACSIGVVLATACGVPTGPLRIVTGLVITFFAPGYAALLAVRPRHLASQSLLILSLPLSFALVVVVGLALNVSPYGLRPDLLSLILAEVSSVLLVVGLWRALRVRGGTTASVRQASATRLRRIPRGAALVRIVALSGLLAATLAWAGYGVVRASREIPQPFTELYLRDVMVVQQTENQVEAIVHLGLNNREDRPMTYTVQILASATDHPAVLVFERALELPDGTSWGDEIGVRFTCGDVLEARVAVPGRPEPYRWVHVRPACGAAPQSVPGGTDAPLAFAAGVGVRARR